MMPLNEEQKAKLRKGNVARVVIEVDIPLFGNTSLSTLADIMQELQDKAREVGEVELTYFIPEIEGTFR